MKRFRIKRKKYIVPRKYKSSSIYKIATLVVKNWIKNSTNKQPLRLNGLKLQYLPVLPRNLKELWCGDNNFIDLPDLSNIKVRM